MQSVGGFSFQIFFNKWKYKIILWPKLRASRIDLGPTTNKNQQRINHKKSFEQPETYETNKNPPNNNNNKKETRWEDLSPYRLLSL